MSDFIDRPRTSISILSNSGEMLRVFPFKKRGKYRRELHEWPIAL